MYSINLLVASNPKLGQYVAIELNKVQLCSSTTWERTDHLQMVIQLLLKAGLML